MSGGDEEVTEWWVSTLPLLRVALRGLRRKPCLQISGGHGLGKTTVARMIADTFHLPFVPLDPTAAGYSRLQTSLPSFPQRHFMQWQLEQQRRHARAVFDRGLEDSGAYAILYGLLTRKEVLAILQKEAWWRRRRIHVIVLVGRPLTHRPEAKVESSRVSTLIIDLLEETRMDYSVVEVVGRPGGHA
ncbi:MAG: hypothetical protein DRJ18_02875 [Candidatus Methanomethylicota archaeon]|nr:MAG: hypothetical protein DRJ18_02875 [Candidatus Verstraetearchaeota archaeon]